MYRMGYVCRHDEHLTLRKTINVLCDVNFRLPVQYLTYGIERRGMLAQLLSSSNEKSVRLPARLWMNS